MMSSVRAPRDLHALDPNQLHDFGGWQNAVKSTKTLLEQGVYERCADACRTLLSAQGARYSRILAMAFPDANVRTRVRLSHAAYLHFHGALAHELLAESLDLLSDKDQLDNKLMHLQAAQRSYERALQCVSTVIAPGPDTARVPATVSKDDAFEWSSRVSPAPGTAHGVGTRASVARPSKSSQRLSSTSIDSDRPMSISQFPRPSRLKIGKLRWPSKVSSRQTASDERRGRSRGLSASLSAVPEAPAPDPFTTAAWARSESPKEQRFASTPLSKRVMAGRRRKDSSSTASSETMESSENDSQASTPCKAAGETIRSAVLDPGQMGDEMTRRLILLQPILREHQIHVQDLVAAAETVMHQPLIREGVAVPTRLEAEKGHTWCPENVEPPLAPQVEIASEEPASPVLARRDGGKNRLEKIAEGRQRQWRRERFDASRTQHLCSTALAELAERNRVHIRAASPPSMMVRSSQIRNGHVKRGSGKVNESGRSAVMSTSSGSQDRAGQQPAAKP